MSTITPSRPEDRAAQRSPARGARSRRSDEAVARLVCRAAAGDERAWEELVDEFSGLVWSVVRSYGVNEADAADISQITWLRLHRHVGRLRDRARVGAWLATTARRQCMLVHRTARSLPLLGDLPEPSSGAPAPDAALLARERDLALRAAIDELSERDRTLLRLLMSDPAPSYIEISAATGMAIGSIGPTRARALERLRRVALRHGLSDADC